MHLKKHIKDFIILVLKIIPSSKKPPIDTVKIRRILIFAYTGIGNYILYTPTLKLLRYHFPNSNITLQYGNSTGCENITKNSNIIDEYIEIKATQSWLDFIYFGIKNRNKFDVIISEFHNNRWKLAVEMVFLNTPIKIGHISGENWKNNYDFLYNYPVQMKAKEHEILRYLKLLQPLSIRYDFKTEKFNTEVYINNKNLKNAQKFYSRFDIHKKTIGIQVGTSPTMRWKQWPLDKYQGLIEKLNHKFNIVLIGAPSEIEMIEMLISNIKGTKNIYIYAGNGTLLDASALISMLDMMITNDSGLMHIANAFNIPLVAIYGPTDFNRTVPLGKNSYIVKLNYDCMPCFTMNGDNEVVNCQHKYQCLNNVGVELVYEKICEIFSEECNSKSDPKSTTFQWVLQ